MCLINPNFPLHQTKGNMAYTDFTRMSIWQKAINLLIDIYTVTSKFPGEEKFGMISDMRRAANSVLHNIAEGYGRFENKDKSRFYKISRGSAYELISQLYASQMLGYLSKDDNDILVAEYMALITEEDLLIKSVESL